MLSFLQARQFWGSQKLPLHFTHFLAAWISPALERHRGVCDFRALAKIMHLSLTSLLLPPGGVTLSKKVTDSHTTNSECIWWSHLPTLNNPVPNQGAPKRKIISSLAPTHILILFGTLLPSPGCPLAPFRKKKKNSKAPRPQPLSPGTDLWPTTGLLSQRLEGIFKHCP